jgi:DNA-binding protein H-NS
MSDEQLRAVLVKVAHFAKNYLQGQAGGLSALEEGGAALSEASKALAAHLQSLREEEERQKVKKALDAFKEMGFTAAQIAAVKSALTQDSGRKPEKTKGDKAAEPKKYRNPENHEDQWSGRGSNEPEWIKLYRTSKYGEKPRRYSDAVLNPEWLALQNAKQAG